MKAKHALDTNAVASRTMRPVPPTGLYPREGVRPTTSNAEQAVYRALSKGLPAGWTAWHSLRIRVDRGVDGESDFVFAIPDRGVLVLEVKGGEIEARDGRWLQNGRPLAKAPREQAHDFAQKLLWQFRDRYRGRAPWVAIATAFPETSFDAGPTHGDVAGAVLGEQDLPYIGDALLSLAERLFRRDRPPDDDGWVDLLHALWGETWVPRLSLGARARLREKELVALDADQVALLNLVVDNERTLVRGGAGTGKTLLATELYRRWAEADRAPLFLCWTRALALELSASGVPDAWTVREFAGDMLSRAGVDVQDGARADEWTPATWDSVTTRALETRDTESATTTPIIVDEAQDFTAADWRFVEALSLGQPLWAFGDPGQNFWRDERQIPQRLFQTMFTLPRRYRCPDSLADFAELYASDARARASEPAPIEELRVVTVADTAAIEGAVAAELQRLLADGIAPSDIAVLSLAGRTKTQLCRGTMIGGQPVVRADDDRAHEQTVADTFLRFKGLERPWVIVTELGLGPTKYDVRMHVALTRATVGCVVVATQAEVEADARLAAAAPRD
jgi:hypothetical protein